MQLMLMSMQLHNYAIRQYLGLAIMKDIGYYAGFLSTENQEKINKATKDQLVYLLADISYDMAASTEFSLRDFEYEPQEGDDQPLQFAQKAMDRSDRDKIALIRGLCDRIEVKLMEEAKND